MSQMPEPVGMTEAQRNLIVRALVARGVRLPCPRCGNLNFEVESHLHLIPVQATLDGLILGGPNVPVAITYCQQCAWVAQHALGGLGLLNNPEFERAGEA